MAKQEATEADRAITEDTEPQPTATVIAEVPEAGRPQRQWQPNPFPIKTVNLDGYKVQLQASRGTDAGWQLQIKFGDGGKDEIPSDAVRTFLESHRLRVRTKNGDEKEVQMFNWNDLDRAWGMGIDLETPATSRGDAEKIYKEVVERVAAERGAGRER